MSNTLSRRQTLKMSLTFIVGLTTTSLAFLLSPKDKNQAQAIVVQQPNEFELQGDDTQIKYLVSNGVPQLNYQSSNLSLSFSDQEIQTLTTDIGTLITVILSRPNPDVGGNIVKLSLLLPTVNLLIGSGQAIIKTDAIVTTEKTSGNILSSPQLGQLQSYKIVALNGTARVVNS